MAVRSQNGARGSGASPAELLEARREAQRRRANTLNRVRAGEINLSGLLLLARADQAIGKIRLGVALRAFPGWGPKRVTALCNQHRVDPGTRLRAVSSWKVIRHHLTAAVDDPVSERPMSSSRWPFCVAADEHPLYAGGGRVS